MIETEVLRGSEIEEFKEGLECFQLWLKNKGLCEEFGTDIWERKLINKWGDWQQLYTVCWYDMKVGVEGDQGWKNNSLGVCEQGGSKHGWN